MKMSKYNKSVSYTLFLSTEGTKEPKNQHFITLHNQGEKNIILDGFIYYYSGYTLIGREPLTVGEYEEHSYVMGSSDTIIVRDLSMDWEWDRYIIVVQSLWQSDYEGEKDKSGQMMDGIQTNVEVVDANERKCSVSIMNQSPFVLSSAMYQVIFEKDGKVVKSLNEYIRDSALFCGESKNETFLLDIGDSEFDTKRVIFLYAHVMLDDLIGNEEKIVYDSFCDENVKHFEILNEVVSKNVRVSDEETADYLFIELKNGNDRRIYLDTSYVYFYNNNRCIARKYVGDEPTLDAGKSIFLKVDITGMEFTDYKLGIGIFPYFENGADSIGEREPEFTFGDKKVWIDDFNKAEMIPITCKNNSTKNIVGVTCQIVWRDRDGMNIVDCEVVEFFGIAAGGMKTIMIHAREEGCEIHILKMNFDKE